MSDREEREALANELENLLGHEAYYPSEIELDYFAGGLLAAGYRKPRTVTTAEELDALPDGSVVATCYGDAVNLHRSVVPNTESWHFIVRGGPATVLREGPAPEAVAS